MAAESLSMQALPLTFAPMDGHCLDPLEQQVLMDGIHISLLLCKDEHLSRKANFSHRS